MLSGGRAPGSIDTRAGCPGRVT